MGVLQAQWVVVEVPEGVEEAEETLGAVAWEGLWVWRGMSWAIRARP